MHCFILLHEYICNHLSDIFWCTLFSAQELPNLACLYIQITCLQKKKRVFC
jgi:hypothetical protein